MNSKNTDKKMDHSKRFSKENMIKVTNRNNILDYNLQRENLRINKMMGVVQKESRQIETARRLIANEINSRKIKHVDNIFSSPQTNSNKRPDTVNVLSHSKQSLNSVLLKAKAFKPGQSGMYHSKSQDDCLPQITGQTGALKSAADLEKISRLKDVNPDEKVRRYIEHLEHVSDIASVDDSNERPATVSSFHTIHGSYEQKSLLAKTQDFVGDKSPKVDAKTSRQIKKKGASKILSRRHSVMGITLNVPYIPEKSPELYNERSDNQANFSYPKTSQLTETVRTRRSSVPAINSHFKPNADYNDNIEQKRDCLKSRNGSVSDSSQLRSSTPISIRNPFSGKAFRRSSVPTISLGLPYDMKKQNDFTVLEEVSVSSDGDSKFMHNDQMSSANEEQRNTSLLNRRRSTPN